MCSTGGFPRVSHHGRHRCGVAARTVRVYDNPADGYFFAERLAGGLGQRITATAGNLGALVNTTTWRVVPPLTDFVGALAIFLWIDWRMGAALAVLVAGFTSALIALGQKGRPL